MQAVVCHGPQDYRLETRPVRQPGPGEVLVKVIAAGICAGDVKCFQGTPMFWGDANRKAYAETDVIPGHEFVGRVVALGEGAGAQHGLAVGDVAVSEQIVPCGECRFCREGNYWMCQPHDLYGFHRITQGSWAEYMIFPAKSRNYRLPEGMDPLAFAAGSAAPAEVVAGGSAGEPAAPSGSGRDTGPDGGGEDESAAGVGHRGPGDGHGSGHGGGEA